MISAVSATAVIAASVALTVMLVVMIATDIGIKGQISGNESCNGIIGTACHAAVQLNARCGQSCLRAATNTAANQNVRVQRGQNTG